MDELKEHVKRQLSKGYKPEDIRKALIKVGFSSSEVKEAFKAFEPKKRPLLHRIFKPKESAKKAERKPRIEKEEKIPAAVKLFKPVPKPTFPEKPVPEIPAKPEAKELPPPEAIKGMVHELPQPPMPSPKEAHRKMGAIIAGIITVVVLTAAILFFVTPICFTEKCFIDAANECGHAKYKNSIKGTTVSYETDGCVLIKKITALGQEEPAEIVNAFLGKSMTCRYQQNKFDILYITSITGLINTCEGELKEEVMKRVV